MGRLLAFFQKLFVVCVVILFALDLGTLAFKTYHYHDIPYRDAWWHIAVADEFAQTGHLAKDPFYRNAPHFRILAYLIW